MLESFKNLYVLVVEEGDDGVNLNALSRIKVLPNICALPAL